MNKQDMEILLQKFLAAETSAKEEQQMAEYFRSHHTPASWQPYRILLLRPKLTINLDTLMKEDETTVYEHLTTRRSLHPLMIRLAAAAVIILIAGSAIWWSMQPPAVSVTPTEVSHALPTSITRLITSRSFPQENLYSKSQYKSREQHQIRTTDKVARRHHHANFAHKAVIITNQLTDSITTGHQLAEIQSRQQRENQSYTSEIDADEMDRMEARSLQRINYYRHKLDDAKTY